MCWPANSSADSNALSENRCNALRFLAMHNKPRVAFLIPIASHRTTKNWHLACGYFKQTLSSVINSKDPNYCVVVVGHGPPEFQLPNDARFKFLSLDHPVPSKGNGYWLPAIKDKLIKLAAAWSYAKSVESTVRDET